MEGIIYDDYNDDDDEHDNDQITHNMINLYLGASDFEWYQIYLIPQSDGNNDDNNNNDDDYNNNDDDNYHDGDEPDDEDQNCLKIANFQSRISIFFMIKNSEITIDYL